MWTLTTLQFERNLWDPTIYPVGSHGDMQKIERYCELTMGSQDDQRRDKLTQTTQERDKTLGSDYYWTDGLIEGNKAVVKDHLKSKTAVVVAVVLLLLLKMHFDANLEKELEKKSVAEPK